MNPYCIHYAKCSQDDNISLYYCRTHCEKRPNCILLTVGRPKTSTIETIRKYKNDWGKRNRSSVNKTRQKTRDGKAKWLENLKKEKGCCVCSYSKCSKSIDSHHIEKKTHNISVMFRQNYSLQEIKKELKKCVFLCKNCHYEVHFGITQLPENMERAQ